MQQKIISLHKECSKLDAQVTMFRDQEELYKLKSSNLNDRLFASLEKVRQLELVAAKYYTSIESKMKMGSTLYDSNTIIEKPCSSPNDNITNENFKERHEMIQQISILTEKLNKQEAISAEKVKDLEILVSTLQLKLSKAEETISVQSEELETQYSKCKTADNIIKLLQASIIKR